MGKRGPKPTPTATLAQRGSWLAKRRGSEPEPKQLGQCPDPPRRLGVRARNIWRSLAPSLWASGRLTADDLDAFARYCMAMREFERLGAKLDVNDRAAIMSWRDLHTMLKEYDARFGLTPADRAEMGTQDPAHRSSEPPVGSGGLSVVR